jgi:phenylalanyl-tRNA synthetase alpha chain
MEPFDIKELEAEAIREINQAQDTSDLEKLRVKYLGRKGLIAEIISNIPNLSLEERPNIGRLANELKEKLAGLIANRKLQLSPHLLITPNSQPELDITLPGIRQELGTKHPISLVIDEICDIFLNLGFRIVEGPEIETEYYNFEALNMPPDHPSRDTFDTFYITDKLLLRSHTSPVQIRVMEKEKPPLAIIVPGRVFRPDAVDASHSFMFHQVEGLMVDRGVSFSDLKGALSIFLCRLFGEDTKMRFRPHFFPFTEPSAEVDISCIICRSNQEPGTSNQKKRCSVCGGKGWLEILGAGMVDPEVFRAVGYDPEKYTGFAFGMGVERIAMLKYGIDDIRLFFENDLRFLKQF